MVSEILMTSEILMATSYSEMHGAGSKLTAICELSKDNCEPQISTQGNQELTVRHSSLTNSCLPPPYYRVHMENCISSTETCIGQHNEHTLTCCRSAQVHEKQSNGSNTSKEFAN